LATLTGTLGRIVVAPIFELELTVDSLQAAFAEPRLKVTVPATLLTYNRNVATVTWLAVVPGGKANWTNALEVGPTWAKGAAPKLVLGAVLSTYASPVNGAICAESVKQPANMQANAKAATSRLTPNWRAALLSFACLMASNMFLLRVSRFTGSASKR